MSHTNAAQRRGDHTTDNTAIRPFQKVNFPEADLTELRRRIKQHGGQNGKR